MTNPTNRRCWEELRAAAAELNGANNINTISAIVGRPGRYFEVPGSEEEAAVEAFLRELRYALAEAALMAEDDEAA